MKKLFTLLAAFALLGNMAVGQFTLMDSLQLWYPFNTNALDMSGHSRDGIVNGATLTTDRFNNANSAYEFDGVDDWINTAYSFDYQYRTVSVWANAYDITGTGNSTKDIFIQDANTLNYGWTIILYDNNQLSLAAGGEALHFSAGTANTWVHIVVIRDDATCRYYIDNVQQTNGVSGTVGSGFNPNLEGVIGTARIPTVQWFNGKIDDLRIYNRALSTSEVDSLFMEGVVGINEQNDKDNFTIYPNPTTGRFTIQGATAEIQIFDLFGRLLLRSNEEQIDMSSYPAGLYIWRVGEAWGKVVLE